MPPKTPSNELLPPPWWDDNLLPYRLLHKFLDQLEAGRRPYLKVTPKVVPELYDFQGQDAEYLWALLQSLDYEFHILSIKLAQLKPHDEPYDNAKIYFMADKEPMVRQWLNRPAFDPYAITWAHELTRLQDKFEDAGAALWQRHIRVKGMSAAQVVQAFAALAHELRQPTTLRTLSARCFAGDSKFLDPHEPLLRALYPSLMANLRVRPVMLTVHLAASPTEILFVENQDTFLALAEADLPNVTLVYSAGFRGSAARVREFGQVVFSYLNVGRNIEAFHHAWFNRNSDALPVFFWGDLDYAGMSILKALRQSFAGLNAWRPGYEPLRARLQQGRGHTQISGVKNQQSDPGATGCEYADTVLLSAIRQENSFIDQEAIMPHELTL
ncbi:Wadjet anti-phage system protein JetD domain-containing protein [Gilvimarinus polysaccharolyticus]|uniref:Wadjet anti-phage system protein JetD domain-containing protein n=1 Tax=Gilvimarinus polysaccharolyticus TaxID=863921 RepID=UPI0006732318|nr:Wadjet anti-phage system protein JetD domain-containing protein [Gilvimarinus polysaccharolyticus]